MSNTITDPKIPYVSWRRGRPRFVPSPKLRKLGFGGEDLRHEDGRWFTAGDCLEWSRTFSNKLMRDPKTSSKRGKPKGKKAVKPVAPKPITRIYPVSQLWDEWLNPAHHPEMFDNSPVTVDNYRKLGKVFETHAADIWQSEVAALDKPICKGLYSKLRTVVGMHQSYNAMRALGVAIQWAIDLGRVRSLLMNPAHKLKMKTPPPRIRVATVEEIDVLVAIADEMKWHEIGDAVIFAVWSGQRQADRLEFEIEGASDARMEFLQSKTGARVSLPKAPQIVERMEAMQERRRRLRINSNRVMLDERRKQPFKADYYRHVFDDVRKAAAVKLPSIADLRDQDLRDTAVTWLARAGCTIWEICAITGHSFKTATDILKHYLALHPEMADSAIAKMVAWHATQTKKTAKGQAA